jgi:beta-lactamase class D
MNLTESQRYYGKSYEWFVGRTGTRTRKGREGLLNHYRKELYGWAVGYPAEGQNGYLIYAEHFSEFMKKHGTERY